MKGIVSFKLNGEGISSIKEQLKHGTRFRIDISYVSTGLRTLYIGRGMIMHEFWLHDPQIIYDREPLFSLEEIDPHLLPVSIEIRLTNTKRRMLIESL